MDARANHDGRQRCRALLRGHVRMGEFSFVCCTVSMMCPISALQESSITTIRELLGPPSAPLRGMTTQYSPRHTPTAAGDLHSETLRLRGRSCRRRRSDRARSPQIAHHPLWPDVRTSHPSRLSSDPKLLQRPTSQRPSRNAPSRNVRGAGSRFATGGGLSPESHAAKGALPLLPSRLLDDADNMACLSLAGALTGSLHPGQQQGRRFRPSLQLFLGALDAGVLASASAWLPRTR